MVVDHHAEFADYLSEEKHIAPIMRKQVKTYQSKTALADKATGTWKNYSWKEFGELSDAISKGLLALDVGVGDRVGIFSQNRAAWTIADIGILSARAATVPVYATNSEAELDYIVEDSELRILFVNDQDQLDKAIAVRKSSEFLNTIIVFDETVKLRGDKNTWTFSSFLEFGRTSEQSKNLEKRMAEASSSDLYTLIYTSGTTDLLKGTMLTYKNVLAALYGTGYPMPVTQEDVSFSFLPLSHVFEQSWSYFMLSRGAENHYCHDTTQIKEMLAEVRPHYMVSVPRVWEKIYGTIMEGLKSASPVKQKLFNRALAVGSRYYPLKNQGSPVSLSLVLSHAVAKELVLDKIQAVVGGRNKFYNAGGTHFSPEINEYFVNAGIRLGVGYGLTELFPVCVCTPEDIGFGTSGKPIPHTDVRISDFGELQVKSPTMMTGYWKKEEAYKDALTDDGWLKTGDHVLKPFDNSYVVFGVMYIYGQDVFFC